MVLLSGGRDAMCLGSVSDGSSEPVAATNSFCECLLTLRGT